jgi:hypothetical protein
VKESDNENGQENQDDDKSSNDLSAASDYDGFGKGGWGGAQIGSKIANLMGSQIQG